MDAKNYSKFFPLIFDSISHGIFTIDSDSRITSFNRMAEQITGYSRQEVIGRPCNQVFQAETCQDFCPLQQSITTLERIEARETVITIKDGRKVPIELSTAALIKKKRGGCRRSRDV